MPVFVWLLEQEVVTSLVFTSSLVGRNEAVKKNQKKQLEMLGITYKMYFPVPRMLSTLLSRTSNFYLNAMLFDGKRGKKKFFSLY